MSLNSRCMHILHFILSQDKYVKINQLKENFKVSERTIRYDLDEIGYWLEKQDLGRLERIYSKGISITCSPDKKVRIFELLEGKLPNDFFYSAEERQKIILLELLNAEQPIKIESLQKKLMVSRGTIIKELKIIDDWLGNYKLKLIRKPNYGIEILGEEVSKRNALLGIAKDFMTTEQILNVIKAQNDVFSSDDNSYKKYGINQNKILFSIDMSLLEKLMNTLQDLLGTKLGDISYASLFTHLAIALQRIKAGRGIFIPHEEFVILQNTSEFKIAEEFARQLGKSFDLVIPASEIGYITLHILGAQLQKPAKTSQNEIEFKADDKNTNNFTAINLLPNNYEVDYYEIAKEITNYVSQLLGIRFNNLGRLLIELSTHLKPAIYRCKYNMPLSNPLLEDIKKQYYRLFLIVKEAFKKIKIICPLDFDDHEISYIVLHFAAEIEKEKVVYSKPIKVILVCASGIGTAKMLYSRLVSNFNDLNIVDIVSYLDFSKKSDLDADLVISTINIKSDIFPCIVVNPLLNEEDLLAIENFILLNSVKHSKEIEITDKTRNTLHEPNFNNEASLNPIALRTLNSNHLLKKTLFELLTAECIKLEVEVHNWEEAIESGANILLHQKLIEPKYTTALKETINNIGPYIVIAPGIALSHAKPSDGVLGIGMSLIRLKKPIFFGHPENDPVKLVFTLATPDSSSHHMALTQLMKIFLSKSALGILNDSSDINEILTCIKQFSNSTTNI